MSERSLSASCSLGGFAGLVRAARRGGFHSWGPVLGSAAEGMNIQGLWLTEFAGRSDEKGLCRTLEQQRGWMEARMYSQRARPHLHGSLDTLPSSTRHIIAMYLVYKGSVSPPGVIAKYRSPSALRSSAHYTWGTAQPALGVLVILSWPRVYSLTAQLSVRVCCMA